MKRFWLVAIFVAAFLTPVLGASLNTTVLNVAGNTPYYQVEFGTASASASYLLANQYLSLAFTPFTSVPIWKIDIYTNNTNSTAPGQKGGLVGMDNTAFRLPLAWKVNNSTGGSTAGNPDTAGTLWQWLGDKNDPDWSTVRDAGYTAVITADSSGAKIYGGLPSQTTVFVYLQAQFSGAAAGNYQGTIWFDMYPVVDMNPPVFTHNPITTIVGRRNLIVIKGSARDDKAISYVRIHYKTDISGWIIADLPLTGTALNKKFTFTGKLSDLGNITEFDYALETSDGWNVTWYKSEADPVKVKICDELSFPDILSGEFDIYDGNQDGGFTKIVIPDGALSHKIGLSTMPNYVTRARAGISPVTAYTFGPDGSKFSKQVTLAIHYYDLLNDGNVELADGTPTGIKETDLRIFWWDGFDWRLVGGKIDPDNNTVTIQTDHFSTYALFASGALSASDYRPKEKIITPASPGAFDTARFDGLNGVDFNIKIFDVTGRTVRSIAAPQLPEWDGRDEAGNIVESGVYIYQFDADISGSKKLISGTIIVAK